MPCSKCGRTAKHEWWSFAFDRKTKEFYCPFCPSDFRIMNKSEELRYNILLFFSVLCLFAVVFVFSASVGNFRDVDYNISKSSELVETQEADLWNHTETASLKFSGTIRTDQENGSVVKRDIVDIWRIVERNFTLVVDGEEIEVELGSFTEVYQFNSSDSRPREFGDGDEILIIGVTRSVNASVVLKAEYLYDQEPDVNYLKRMTFGAYGFMALAVPVAILILPPQLTPGAYFFSRIRRRKGSRGPGVLKGHPDEAVLNKILSEGTQMHSYDHFAPPLFFLLTSLFYLFLVKDELPSWASIFEPNILTLGLIFFALFLLFILFSGHLNFQAIQTPGFDISGAYVRKVVIHERGVLFYKNTREPLFLDWEELSKSSSDNYITGPLSQSMSEAIDSEVSRRRKEIMNAQMETYQQRQSEENTASEPTTEED